MTHRFLTWNWLRDACYVAWHRFDSVVFWSRIPDFAGLAVGLLGCGVLLGWLLDVAVLKSIHPAWVSMKANTAIGFVLCGVALCLKSDAKASWRAAWPRVDSVLALAVFLLGLLNLFQYVSGTDLGVDQLLFQEPAGAVGTLAPGRMAPATALCFLFFGLALMLDRHSAHTHLKTLLAFATALPALAGILGYLYHVPNLYGLGNKTQMASHTALAFLLLSFGLICLQYDTGVIGLIRRRDSGGRTARLLFPVVLLLPPLIGWLKLTGDRSGLIEPAFSVGIVAITYIITFLALITWHADALSRTETEQKRLKEILQLNMADLTESHRELARRERALLEMGRMAKVGGWELDLTSNQLKWSDEVFSIHETPRHFRPNLEETINFFVDESRPAINRALKDAIEQGIAFDLELQIKTLTGKKRWVQVIGKPHGDEGQVAHTISGTFQNITERKAGEEKLRQLSHITEQAPLSIVITDLQGAIEYVNPKFQQVTGYTTQDVIGQNPRILQSGQTPPPVYTELWQTLLAGGVWRGEFHNRKKNGEVFVEKAVISPIVAVNGVVSHYVALKEDITLQKLSQRKLEQLVQEKTALLNEVHHRVKNNLQVITSLLRLEEGRSTQMLTKTVLHEMQGRIRSMALVHETLYRSGTYAAVNLASYIRQVVTMAFTAQTSGSGAVRLVLNLEPVTATIDQATPCGLLVNELISNSLKHGFSPTEHGEVCVDLLPVTQANDSGTQYCCLRVRDTGVGLPPDFDARRAQSLGLQLVSDLARQLGGTLDVTSSPGATFAITFPIEAPKVIGDKT